MSDQKFFNHRDAPLQAPQRHVLSVADMTRKPSPEQRNPDPYNTSGSFDRKKNWARVGKR